MFSELTGDESIARTESTTPAAVGENDDSPRIPGDTETPLQSGVFCVNLDLSLARDPLCSYKAHTLPRQSPSR